MDIDAGKEPRQLVHHARCQRRFAQVQPVRHAMQENGMKSRIAQHDFQTALRCRILMQDGIDLFPDSLKHF
jgi:hypothetical protein